MSAIADFGHYGYLLFTPNGILYDLKNFGAHQIHAIHIHEFGDTSHGCASLGGHYNPTGQPHGHHLGDLVFNFKTDRYGRATFETPLLGLDVEDIYGRSVVIHKFADDLGVVGELIRDYPLLSDEDLGTLCRERGYKNTNTRAKRIQKLVQESMSNGNAGERITCAIIGRRKF